jgi:hypothetical protein
MHPVQRFFSLFLLDYDIGSLPFNPLKIARLASHASYDQHLAGFGVFLMEISVFINLIIFFSIKKDRGRYKALLFPAMLLLFISLIMPENWWARYIPFFWYFPSFFIIASDYSGRKNKKLFFLLSAVVIINSFSFFVLNTMYGVLYTVNLKKFLTGVKESGNDTIHVILEQEYFKHTITEKMMVYDIEKNVIFIEDEESSFANGVGMGRIRGWY